VVHYVIINISLKTEEMCDFTKVATSSAQGSYINSSAAIEANDLMLRNEVLAFVLAIFAIDELPVTYKEYECKMTSALELLQCALHVEVVPEKIGTLDCIENICATYAFDIVGEKIKKQHPVYRSPVASAILLHYATVKREGLCFGEQMMIAEYPDMCARLSGAGLQELICYRNYMATAHQIVILSERGEHDSLDVIYCISQGKKLKKGDKQQLITGGQQKSPRVVNRRDIYARESTRSTCTSYA
jgi:hypothetical protein